MKIEPTAIPDVLLIHPERHGDDRGFFVETYRADMLEEAGVRTQFVQDNMAYSSQAGVVRGLHFQAPPRAQAKLIQVLDGEIFDVAVDLRRASPTFGQHVGFRLSAETGVQAYIPVGFAHGYCTLTADTRVSYKVTDYYAPAHEGGLLWSDPALGVDWPIVANTAILSPRDRGWPRLESLDSPFA